MGLTYVTAILRVNPTSKKKYAAQFLVDTGATDCMAPRDKLSKAGIRPIGKTIYELADGTKREYQYGLVTVEFMGEITAGRVLFGPEEVEPILGVTALESVGILVDANRQTLKRIPAIPLK